MSASRALATILPALCFVLVTMAGPALAGNPDSFGDRIVGLSFEPADAAPALHGAEIVPDGLAGSALRLAKGRFAAFEIGGALTSKAGTIAFWVKPDLRTAESQTYVALKWSGRNAGYLAISQGWWEPTGKDRLYFILSNTEGLHCSVKYRLPPAKWSQVVAVWSGGLAGACALYVNGEPLARHDATSKAALVADGPLYLGSDAPTTEARGRGAGALIDEFVVLRRPATAAEIAEAYARGKARHGRADQIAGPWVDEALESSRIDKAHQAGRTGPELRAIFHEGIDWALSRAATDEVIARLSTAGFNAYIPCAWYGPGARFPSDVMPVDPRLARRMARGDDPLAYLIESAHRAGIEVHACLTVARRGSRLFPEFAMPGTPIDAYDLHDPAFRTSMVELATELARRYPIDGLNLDYIRTMGFCVSPSCAADYRQRFGRSLRADTAEFRTDPAAAGALRHWNLDAVTTLVRDLSLAVRAVRPGLVLSVDAHPNDPELLLQGQDSVAWANAGLVDLVFDMSYQRVVDLATIDQARAMLEIPSKLAIMLANYDGEGREVTPRKADLMGRYVALVRGRWPGMGLAIYNYMQLTDEQIEAFSRTIFSENASPEWQKIEQRQTLAGSPR